MIFGPIILTAVFVAVAVVALLTTVTADRSRRTLTERINDYTTRDA